MSEDLQIFYLFFIIICIFLLMSLVFFKIRKSTKYIVKRKVVRKKKIQKPVVKKQQIDQILLVGKTDKYSEDYLPEWTDSEKKLYALIKAVLIGEKEQVIISEQEWQWYDSVRYKVAKRRFLRKNPNQREIKKSNGVRSKGIQFEINKV